MRRKFNIFIVGLFLLNSSLVCSTEASSLEDDYELARIIIVSDRWG